MQEKKSDKEKPDFVKWFQELNKDSGKIAGGKGANLAEIYNLKIPVPPGFVVTAQAYDYFIEKAGIKQKIKSLLETIKYEDTKNLDEVVIQIRELILNSKLPKEIEEEILESYEHLGAVNMDLAKGSALDILKNSAEPIFVAVRSSATAEDLEDASFAGQQDSFVNIKGDKELLEHIKKCFASLFTSRATYYRNKKGFKHEETSLAVVVQKMVDSDKSGVIFSKDPSYKNENTIIEAVWGLGEGIVSGKITPDKYILSSDLKIIDKKISNKKIAITRNSEGKNKIVKLREEKSKHQVLTDYEIKKLTEIALKLEEHYKKPQDIEFAIEGENIYIVQTRPVTTIEKRIEESKIEIKGEAILTGIPASPGIASGKIKIVNEMKDLDKVKQGNILVTKMTNPDMVVTMQKSAAIVTDEGGLTAHAAIVSREMGIPCIVGTEYATERLKEGEVITVDGFSGKIYKGKVSEDIQKEILPVTAKTKTKIKIIVDLPTYAKRAAKTGIKQTGLTRIEGIIAESGKHPQYFLKKNKIKDYEDIIFRGVKGIAEYFEEIWVRTSDIRSDEFQNLEEAPEEIEPNPMLGMHGIRYGIKHPEILKAELNALKRVSEDGVKIGILAPQIISVEEVKKIKKILKEINFSNVKLGVMIETPASVQMIRELCEEKIDFISFGTNDLTQYILAVDRGNEQVQHLYNEMHPAVLHQIEYVIRVCKRNNVETSICGQAGSEKEMVKFLIEKEIDSISVNADAAKEISDYVAEIEQESIKGTDKEPRRYDLKKETHSEKEEFPKIPGAERLTSEKLEEFANHENPHLEEDIKAIEKEKQEYLKKNLKENSNEESEFEEEVSGKQKNKKGEALDIF
ncbi:MAG: phosphoenolpyruvate synthase [archaeon]